MNDFLTISDCQFESCNAELKINLGIPYKNNNSLLKKIPFVFDTGASVTCISYYSLKSLGYNEESILDIYESYGKNNEFIVTGYDNSPANLFYFSIGEINLGGFILNNFYLCTINPHQYKEKNNEINIKNAERLKAADYKSILPSYDINNLLARDIIRYFIPQFALPSPPEDNFNDIDDCYLKLKLRNQYANKYNQLFQQYTQNPRAFLKTPMTCTI